MLDRTAPVRSAGDIAAASRRATRSAISLNRPRDFASSSANRRPEKRNGIVMCATTSRTRQPAQSVGSSQLGAGRPARTSASSARWAAIMSLMVSIAVTSPREEGVYVPATTGPWRKWTFQPDQF